MCALRQYACLNQYTTLKSYEIEVFSLLFFFFPHTQTNVLDKSIVVLANPCPVARSGLWEGRLEDVVMPQCFHYLLYVVS